MSVSGAGVWHCLCCIVWQGRDPAWWGVQGTQACGHPSSCSVNTKIRLQTPDCNVYILCLCGLLLTCIMYLVQLHTGHRHSHLIHGEQWAGPVTGDVTHLTHHPVLQRQQSASYPSHLQHQHRVRGGTLGRSCGTSAIGLLNFNFFPPRPACIVWWILMLIRRVQAVSGEDQ